MYCCFLLYCCYYIILYWYYTILRLLLDYILYHIPLKFILHVASLMRYHSRILFDNVLRLSASCPVLCSGNGQYLKGRCMCHSGWKGSECDVPTNQCIDVTCSGHGTCIVGTCICNPGFKGENCEEGKSLASSVTESWFDFSLVLIGAN